MNNKQISEKCNFELDVEAVRGAYGDIPTDVVKHFNSVIELMYEAYLQGLNGSVFSPRFPLKSAN